MGCQGGRTDPPAGGGADGAIAERGGAGPRPPPRFGGAPPRGRPRTFKGPTGPPLAAPDAATETPGVPPPRGPPQPPEPAGPCGGPPEQPPRPRHRDDGDGRSGGGGAAGVGGVVGGGAAGTPSVLYLLKAPSRGPHPCSPASNTRCSPCLLTPAVPLFPCPPLLQPPTIPASPPRDPIVSSCRVRVPPHPPCDGSLSV